MGHIQNCLDSELSGVPHFMKIRLALLTNQLILIKIASLTSVFLVAWRRPTYLHRRILEHDLANVISISNSIMSEDVMTLDIYQKKILKMSYPLLRISAKTAGEMMKIQRHNTA
ncbi:hypothetical protein FZC70_02190 [Bacillus subtilis]|nr:hypothetical protein [Bacillus subtilis]TYS11677.1 hypothetical protein FZC70_02190 [Bacillus subtilis]